MKFYSPLRYPGGKSKLTKQIISLLETNNYNHGIYVEPFAGGAGIALSLLFNNYVDRIHINDLDTSIYSFWKAILEDNKEFIQLIRDTPITIEEWKHQRSIQDNPENASVLELGFSTFYLNRTNISGIIKGGVIGGYNQSGNYKMDARFNKENLINRIKKIHKFKNKILVTNLCVMDLIKNTLNTKKERYFIYFDPPYYIKGPELYKKHLTHEEHLQISHMIRDLQYHYWVVTYDNVPEINEMYTDFRKKTYTLNYSAGKAAKGKEVMVFSNNLILNYINDDIKIIL